MARFRISRRQFFRYGVAPLAFAAAGSGVYAWRVEPHWINLVERDLPIANLPDALVGRRLVQISDIHVGKLVEDDYLIDAFRQVGELAPDILAITGDFMSCWKTEEIDHVARVLKELPHGKLATVAVLGNHDYGARWDDSSVADALAPRLTDLGVDVLRNASRDVQGLQIAGIDDLWSPRFDPKRVMPMLKPDRAALVLCHNPDAADLPVWHGYQGWILCGHTHGGQCKPPFLPPPILPVKNRRYTRGEIDLGDGRRLYINSGLGYVRRVRFGVRPEITSFTLRRAAERSRTV
jgi:uncharacterized protein